jgi:hypothetical protein
MDNNKNILGYNSADNQFSSALVAQNADGSIIERIEYIMQNMNGTGVKYNAPNYVAVPITFVGASTGAVGEHEVLTVTGMIRLRYIIEVVSTLTDAANNATIQFGVAGATNAFIAASDTDLIQTGEVWIDATPTETYGAFATLMGDQIVCNGLDVGYEVGVEPITGGSVIFHMWWEPLNATGAAVAAAGATAAL